MAKRKDGDGWNKKTVNADQLTYQKVFFDSALPNIRQPIAGPHFQYNRPSYVVQEMRDVLVQRHQQQQGNGPDTAAQVQEMARPEMARSEMVRPEMARPEMSRPETAAVQQSQQKQRPKTAARKYVKIPKPKVLVPVSVDHNKTTNRRFVCDECAKTFFYKHVLQNHIRTHTGEKPYTCLVCQKKFTREHHLTMHKRLHTGERPYLCMCCNKVFIQVSNLRRHLKTHVGCTSMNLCTHCGMVFSTVDDLAVHKGQLGTCSRRSQLLRNKTAVSTSTVASSSTATSSSAAASTSAAATIDFTSAASTSDAAVDSTSATGSAEPSASAFVANRPPASLWWWSTPAHLHPTSVNRAPAPWLSTNYGSSLPNAVGYPPLSIRPYWSPWLPNVYSPQPQPLTTSVSPSPPTASVYGLSPSLPNGHWTINPYLQYQNIYSTQQTEPENLSVHMDVKRSDELVDSDDYDFDKLVIDTDDSDDLVVDV